MIARVVLVLAFVASAGEARAQTRLFITNHVHSDQIGDLTVWQGSLVAGTLGGLLVVAPGSDEPAKILASPGGLPSNRVLSVARSPANALWAGTANRGLGRLTPEGTWRRTLTTFDGLPSDRVQALFVTGDSVWVGTSGGVALFTENPASGQVALRRSDNEASTGGALVSDDVLAFARTGDTLWVGTSGGLSTFTSGVWQNRASTLAQAYRPTDPAGNVGSVTSKTTALSTSTRIDDPIASTVTAMSWPGRYPTSSSARTVTAPPTTRTRRRYARRRSIENRYVLLTSR